MGKISIIVIFLLSTITFTYSQNKEQENILYKFIKAHNIGSEDAITEFIKDTYHPEVYAKINLKAHTTFYKQIVNEFGPLNLLIYKRVEETSSRCVVHLIKKEQYVQNKNINPLEVLVVKIDLSKNDKNFMPHGLGLGSLVCEQKRE